MVKRRNGGDIDTTANNQAVTICLKQNTRDLATIDQNIIWPFQSNHRQSGRRVLLANLFGQMALDHIIYG